jgi:hypothetical protein
MQLDQLNVSSPEYTSALVMTVHKNSLEKFVCFFAIISQPSLPVE